MTTTAYPQRRRSDSSLKPDGHASDWFGEIMFETAEAYGIKIVEARVRIYAHDLSDLPRERVEEAVRRLRREGGQFFPTISDIRRAILGSPEDAALRAWSVLERAAIEIGAWQSWDWEDAWASRAFFMTFDSWAVFCQMEQGPELLVKRKHFIAAYHDARRQHSALRPTVRMMGSHEASGSYKRLESVWAGRVLLDGQIVLERERAALPAADEMKQLPGDTE